MKLIVPNENPDLDGAASTYAYAEFLKKQDEKATGAVFGDINEKTQEILDSLEENLSDASYYLYSADEIVIVSASSMENITTRIPPDKVVEIVDHERIQLDDFSDAELTIEEDFNTAAAIIAEKFKKTETEISNESATLLYEAITQAEEVTEKDQEIADWLEEKKN